MVYDGPDWQSILVAQAVVRRWLTRWRLRKQIKRSKARSRAKFEILTTERTYVESLKMAHRMYLEPLLISNEPGHQKIASREEIDRIFSNLVAVIGMHEEWLAELEKCFEPTKTQPPLGPVMVKLVPQLTIYAEFCDNYFIALYTYTRLKERPLFQQFLDSAAKDGAMDLSSFLIRPVQRIPRYILLLQELIKFTPADHHDFKALNDAARQLKDMTNYINTKVRTAEDIKEMIDIDKKISGAEIHKPHRRFLKEGFITKISRKAVQRRWFILFSDTLMYAAKGAVGAAKWKGTLYLESLWISDLKDTSKFQNGFQLVTPKKTYTVYCKTPEEKTQWIDEINDAIESVEQRNQEDAVELAGLSGQSANKLMKLSGRTRTRIPAKERVKKQKTKRTSGFWRIFTLDPSKFDPDYFDDEADGRDRTASEYAGVNTDELEAGNFDSLARGSGGASTSAGESEGESSGAPGKGRPRARSRGKTVTFDAPPQAEEEDELARMDLDATAARRRRGRAQSIAVGSGVKSLEDFQRVKGIGRSSDAEAAAAGRRAPPSGRGPLNLELPTTSRQKQLDELTAMVQKYHVMLDKAEADNAHLQSLIRDQSGSGDAQSEERRLRDIIRTMKVEHDEQRERDSTQIAVLQSDLKDLTRRLDAVSVENVALTRLFEEEGTKVKAANAKAYRINALIEQNERLRLDARNARELMETNRIEHKAEMSVYEWRVKQLDAEYTDTIQDLRNDNRLLRDELAQVTAEMRKYRYELHQMKRSRGGQRSSPDRPLPPPAIDILEAATRRTTPSKTGTGSGDVDIMVIPLDHEVPSPLLRRQHSRPLPRGTVVPLDQESLSTINPSSPIPSFDPSIADVPRSVNSRSGENNSAIPNQPAAITAKGTVVQTVEVNDLSQASVQVSTLEERIRRLKAQVGQYR